MKVDRILHLVFKKSKRIIHLLKSYRLQLGILSAVLCLLLLFFTTKLQNVNKILSTKPTDTFAPPAIPYIQPKITVIPNYNLDLLPKANIKTLSKKIIYLYRGSILLISDLNGENMSILEKDSILSFDGWSGGGKVFYYSKRGAGGEAILYKRDLTSNQTSKLFSYSFVDDNASSVSVAPNGNLVAYQTEDGSLNLYDLISDTHKVLLKQEKCTEDPHSCIFGYEFPKWSPDSQKLIITRSLWEGGENEVVWPFTSPVETSFIDRTHGEPMWINTSNGFVVETTGLDYPDFGLDLYTNLKKSTGQRLFADIPQLKDMKIIYGAAMSEDNDLIFSYKDGLGIYNLNSNKLKLLASYLDRNRYIVAWVDDNSVIIRTKLAGIALFNLKTKIEKDFPVNLGFIAAVP